VAASSVAHDEQRGRDSSNGQDASASAPNGARQMTGKPGTRGAQPGSAQPAQSPRREDPGAEQRRRLEQRQQSFRALPGEQQQRLRQAEERYRSMSPDQREDLRRRWESMSESDRERYRRRIENRDD
jgi:hypothetical protein